MAAMDVGARNNPPNATDGLDDLFDYDVPAHILRDIDADMKVPQRLQKAPLGDAGRERTEGLGIDEEIKVTKRRAPVVKLDEDRLLSRAGLPKLRTITKERLKFKGKGHEYSDVAQLLNIYQLWLDDLYPRAKFADGLALIEKVGHTKRMQTMRKVWIDEGKSKGEYDDRETIPEVSELNRSSANPMQQSKPGVDQLVRTHETDRGILCNDEVFRPVEANSEAQARSSIEIAQNDLFLSDVEVDNNAPPEDDLDALLAEEDVNANIQEIASTQQCDDRGDDNFDDEMEAMAGLDEMW